MQRFMKKCQEVSFKVLSCFALGLGFEEGFFTKVISFFFSRLVAIGDSVSMML